MRFTIKQLEVVIPDAKQHPAALQTIKVFERELERFADSRSPNREPRMKPKAQTPQKSLDRRNG
jgi:hypothetical protein